MDTSDTWTIGIYAGNFTLNLHSSDIQKNSVMKVNDVTVIPQIVADLFMVK